VCARTAIRAAAWATVALGVAAPLVRRRAKLPPLVVTAASAAAPLALCVVVPRSPRRDVVVVLLQMHSYVATYQMPHDDPEALEARVRVRYPVTVDRLLGLGELPGLRLQRALATEGVIRRRDEALVWSHWLWFLVPHGTVAYVLARHRDRFPRAALSVYATFDLGLIGYWAVPTAPPWYAAQQGVIPRPEPPVPALRRMMYEHGEAFWKSAWAPLYSVLGGNPLAAMPSLHFATSVTSAHVLSDVGRAHGAIGWAYAVTLGFALVYLGEHYVIDLVVGLALAEGVRHGGPRATGALEAVGGVVQRLEARARA
jgi:membrane-associated phospholipid phosphatase